LLLTSTADGIGLAVLARLPLLAEPSLLEAFGVSDDSAAVVVEPSQRIEVPRAFWPALEPTPPEG
jgi:hypothetical protein